MRVPVLSEHTQDVAPNVSTDSRFLISTIFFARVSADRAIMIVTEARRPVGTFPTIIPIAFEIASIHLYFSKIQKINKIIPQTTAIIEIKTVKP